MGQYIWKRKEWPKFRWRSDELLGVLGRARKAQGKIMAQAELAGIETQAHVLVEEAFTTSAIEGEKLDRNSIRSSVARRLGLPTAGLPKVHRDTDGLVEILLNATTEYTSALTGQRLHSWHAALFPTGYSGMYKILVGAWRKKTEPMQVISGPMGKEKVHYEAPPHKILSNEMKEFLQWWKNPPLDLDGIIRAAVAHLWFVTIHPYEDGNGRLARAITDMALAQDEKTGIRLYSLSAQIMEERENYYNILEKTQKGELDITEWLKWFLGMFERALNGSQDIVNRTTTIAKFWQTYDRGELNERQIKAIQRLLEAEPAGFEGGLTNRKYRSLTKTTPETAKRDLADLETKGVLKRNPGKGRSASYSLNLI